MSDTFNQLFTCNLDLQHNGKQIQITQTTKAGTFLFQLLGVAEFSRLKLLSKQIKLRFEESTKIEDFSGLMNLTTHPQSVMF